jgi:glycogen debranching enzyme
MSPDASEERRRRLLTQGEPSHASGISDAVVIKDGELYLVCGRDGGVPIEGRHGLGLYFRDCRFASGYEIRLADTALEPLAASGEDGFRSIFQLTNPRIEEDGKGLNRQRIGVRVRHVIDARAGAMQDELTIENYDVEAHALPLSLAFAADFQDIFVIRGLVDRCPGELRPTRWEDAELVFSYEGGDHRRRELRVRFSEPPARKQGGRVWFDLKLAPHEVKRILVSLAVRETEEGAARSEPRARLDSREAERTFQQSIDEWMAGFAEVSSTSILLEGALDRSLRDLRALRMAVQGHHFIAAGVPWFATLFGRDSIICALQILAYRPEIAAETLRLLARMQGTRVDHERDEEPGKILHELRVGELARMGEIPYSPYYGTVDATPLFLVLMGEYARWTGDLSLFEELRGAVDGALRWIDEYGDHDGDGYVDYCSEGGKRLVNQGWKDSGNGVVDSRGRTAEPPIALVEVQGYVFRAKKLVADLFEQTGDRGRAQALRGEADELRARFNRDFWMEDKHFYALALESGGRKVDAITSNPGQALWTGIVDDAHVEPVVERLMASDMYSGWGVRTLSSNERAYNPIGYHLGTVWPHDNALIAAGLRGHGFEAHACRIFSDLLQAATHFEEFRLPEVFAGFSRSEYGVVVRYPVACHPQAWASGSIPFLLQILLGLEPDPRRTRLFVSRPILPRFVDKVEIRRLRVGAAEADLCFERLDDDQLGVRVDAVRGELHVEARRRS